ncbi:DUF1007 family protein [Rhizobium glycinendophyticum]|uniref:DUF1007 family protein n=1 Tax=Rhizobium glycinendophyticum TaxID=2589807 RepID=A0A504UXV7_9HYPH|nr:DUF1007 family protein [Rhizobium glycinendophyticum]TPP09903.1 DUF1007 family protein [Rhizobium glycinendophyticum]
MRRCFAAMFAALSLLAALPLSTSPAFAHPDMAASVRLSFAMEQSRLTGLAERLVFDATTSRRLLTRFDVDDDGELSDVERGNLEDELLTRLTERHFFTELSLDGEQLILPAPSGAVVRLNAGYVELQVEFRFASPNDLNSATFGVLMRDRDLAIVFRLDPVTPAILSGTPSAVCVTGMQQRRDQAYFGGLVIPTMVTLTCR